MYYPATNTTLSPKYHSLNLADGNSWTIVGEGNFGRDICHLLAHTMQLVPTVQARSQKMILCTSQNTGDAKQTVFSEKILDSVAGHDDITCLITSLQDNTEMIVQLLELSQIFCCKAEEQGGMAIHGALAEREGAGIILAGRGDVGKTTASRRLPNPWRSLSDDCSLIVRDKKNNYHVHPWPTWSSLITGGEVQTWDVQYSAPLKAIFILSQSKTDQVEPIGKGQAVCLLNAAVDQAWWGLDSRLGDLEKQTLRKQRFNNICRLVETIPVFLLHISKNGPFWEEIEKTLPGNAQ